MRPQEFVEKICHHLENHPEGVSINRVHEELNMPRRTVREYLELLTWMGKKKPIYERRGKRGARIFSTQRLAVRETQTENSLIILKRSSLELLENIYTVITHCAASGYIAKGFGRTTLAIEEKDAQLVIIAEDSPSEIVSYLVIECEKFNVPYFFMNKGNDIASIARYKHGKSIPSCAILSNPANYQLLEEILSEIEKLKIKYTWVSSVRSLLCIACCQL